MECGPRDVCDKQSCNCTNIIPIEYGKTIDLVFTNLGPTAFGMHPIHLHGYHFHVLHIGLPTADPVTGKLINQTTDIECEPDTQCAVARWKNGQPPVFNSAKPPLKATVVVPPGGYALVRFFADNPGVWHIHCHMAHHLFYGMGAVLNIGPREQHLFPPPTNFPRCGSFDLEYGEEIISAARSKWVALQQQLW